MTARGNAAEDSFGCITPASISMWAILCLSCEVILIDYAPVADL
jgi:hypothetical protein